jgi:hypothetical protein
MSARVSTADTGIDRPGGDCKNFDLEPSIAGLDCHSNRKREQALHIRVALNV